MGKKKEPDVRQPKVDAQKEYASLRDNDASVVIVRNKKFTLRWLKKGQIAKLGRILLEQARDEENGGTEQPKATNALLELVSSGKNACKAAAVYLLDGYWKLKFNYWWLWRWFYYIKQYDDGELLELLTEGKKKVPLEQFLAVTMSLTGAKDTLMMMRTAEAEHILHELSMAQHTQEQRSVSGSQPPDTSSSA